jgi:hypothetical protein
MTIIRSYTELSRFSTFEERFEYLKVNGQVGFETFGYDRYINQRFYLSPKWRHIRDLVIVRDKGCDLGVEGYEIHGKILIHHMNPVSMEDFANESSCLTNPEFLISTSFETHNAIHYGDESLLPKNPIERKPNDTIPWR